ncbi:MAG: hypothetical protein LBJ00_10895 [Planctomycetaceae bacterium]|jgi:hypothetical protein|nr:hypothetical protein [Planctomycetaceae bacterium]
MSPIAPENNKPRRGKFILILFILIVLNVLTFCLFFFYPYIRQAYIMREVNSSNLDVDYSTERWFSEYEMLDQAISYFFQFEKVTEITIDGEGVTVTPQDINKISKISELSSLGKVYIHNMTITDQLIDVLLNCKKLDVLMLNNIVITDHQLRQLGTISSLKSLDLVNSTKIPEQAFIEFLEANPQLQFIILGNTSLATDQIASAISKLPQLKMIVFCEESLTDKHIEIISSSRSIAGIAINKHIHFEIISSSKSIEVISINDFPHISDDSFQYLKRMPSLDWLCLDGTSTTPAGLIEFKNARPKCEIYRSR